MAVFRLKCNSLEESLL